MPSGPSPGPRSPAPHRTTDPRRVGRPVAVPPASPPPVLCYRCSRRMIRILDRYTLREIRPAVPPGAPGLHVHADDAAHRPERPGAPRKGRVGDRDRADARAARPSGPGHHDPDVVPPGPAGRLRSPVGRQRMGCPPGLRRRTPPGASPGSRSGLPVLGCHAVGHGRRRAAQQPGVPRDGIRRRRRPVENEIKPGLFYEDFPNLVLYARDTTAGGHGWRDVFVADTSQAGAPKVTVAGSGHMLLDRASRTVRMVLEDRVTYDMATDAHGRSVFEPIRRNCSSASSTPRRSFRRSAR